MRFISSLKGLVQNSFSLSPTSVTSKVQPYIHPVIRRVNINAVLIELLDSQWQHNMEMFLSYKEHVESTSPPIEICCTEIYLFQFLLHVNQQLIKFSLLRLNCPVKLVFLRVITSHTRTRISTRISSGSVLLLKNGTSFFVSQPLTSLLFHPMSSLSTNHLTSRNSLNSTATLSWSCCTDCQPHSQAIPTASF